MAVIGQWRDFKFEISPSAIMSFNDLQIKAIRETETVDSNGQQYIKTKIIKPFEISLTVHLHAGLGYDVQAKAEEFRGAPLYGDGRADYFYVGGKKLVPSRLSVTEATISRVEISAGGKWTAADVALTFKQAALIDGTQPAATPTQSTGSGYTKQTVTQTKTTTAMTVASALTTTVTSAVSKAVNTIKSIVTTAKKATASAAPKAGSGGGGKVVAMLR